MPIGEEEIREQRREMITGKLEKEVEKLKPLTKENYKKALDFWPPVELEAGKIEDWILDFAKDRFKNENPKIAEQIEKERNVEVKAGRERREKELEEEKKELVKEMSKKEELTREDVTKLEELEAIPEFWVYPKEEYGPPTLAYLTKEEEILGEKVEKWQYENPGEWEGIHGRIGEKRGAEFGKAREAYKKIKKELLESIGCTPKVTEELREWGEKNLIHWE